MVFSVCMTIVYHFLGVLSIQNDIPLAYIQTSDLFDISFFSIYFSALTELFRTINECCIFKVGLNEMLVIIYMLVKVFSSVNRCEHLRNM